MQYVTWVRDALHLDFGESFVSGQPVFEKVTTAIGITVTIVLISAVIQAVFILLFGCLCYLTRKRMIGHALIFLCIAGVSIPSFFFASTYLDIFAVKLGLTSVVGNSGLMRYLPAAVCIAIDNSRTCHTKAEHLTKAGEERHYCAGKRIAQQDFAFREPSAPGIECAVLLHLFLNIVRQHG